MAKIIKNSVIGIVLLFAVQIANTFLISALPLFYSALGLAGEDYLVNSPAYPTTQGFFMIFAMITIPYFLVGILFGIPRKEKIGFKPLFTIGVLYVLLNLLILLILMGVDSIHTIALAAMFILGFPLFILPYVLGFNEITAVSILLSVVSVLLFFVVFALGACLGSKIRRRKQT